MPQAIVSRITFRVNVLANGTVFLDVAKRSRSRLSDDAEHLPSLAEAKQLIASRYSDQHEHHGRLHLEEVRLTESELEALRSRE
jgi:hypothetical protein